MAMPSALGLRKGIMPKHGTLLASVLVTCALVVPAAAQPGMTPGMTPDQPPTDQLGPPQPAPPPADQPAAAPQPQGPPPGATQATFVSTTSEGWEVLLDREPACATPCSIYVPPMRYVTLRSRDRVLLDVGYLPHGSVVVRGKPLSNGAYAGGIVGTTFAGMGLVTGVTLTAVGWGTGRDGMRLAGLITGGASAVGLYLSIKLMQSAVPKAEVLPATPYVGGNTVGLAGTF